MLGVPMPVQKDEHGVELPDPNNVFSPAAITSLNKWILKALNHLQGYKGDPDLENA